MKTFYINKTKYITYIECFTLNKFKTINSMKNCHIQKLHDLEKHIMQYMYFFMNEGFYGRRFEISTFLDGMIYYFVDNPYKKKH